MQISFTHGPAELPRAPAFRLLVVGAFDPSASDRHRTPIPVSRGDFQSVLDAVAPAVALDIPNALTGAGDTWWIKLQLRSLKDFTPAGLLRQVPELDWIDAFRRTIDDVAAGRRSAPALRDVLDDYAGVDGLGEAVRLCRTGLAEQRPEPSAKAPQRQSGAGAQRADDELDRLFDMVAAPENADSGSSARDAVAGAIAAATRGSGGSRPRPALNAASAAVTALLQTQLQSILAHPRFLALEQAWRGLHWLLAGIGGDVPVGVQILPREAAQAAEAIASASPTEAAEHNARFDLVLCDLALCRTDLDLLRALAAAGETAMAPVLLTLRGDFFETPPDRPLARVRDPANLLDQPEYQAWNAVCEDEPMRWLGACFNDMLLRPPHAAGDRHAAGIAQPGDPLTHGLWGHAGWLVARRVAEQQQQTDWPAPIIGARNGRIQDLPLYSPGEAGQDGQQRPLRHALSPDQAEQLGSVGIIALACAPDQDSAWILNAPSLRRIRSQAQPEQTRALRRDASLSAQLVRARLVHCILAALDDLPGGSPAERAAALEHYARALIADTGGSARAAVTLEPGEPQRLRLELHLGERVLPDVAVELQLDAGGD